MEKTMDEKTLRVIVPAHRPVKRSTLAHILKQAGLEVEDFLRLLR
jgi:predicted RNA binding protein YcfA (HicA-like mRNA interferase family)